MVLGFCSLLMISFFPLLIPASSGGAHYRFTLAVTLRTFYVPMGAERPIGEFSLFSKSKKKFGGAYLGFPF